MVLVISLRERWRKQQPSLLFHHSWLANPSVNVPNVPDQPWHGLSLIEPQRNSGRGHKVDGESVNRLHGARGYLRAGWGNIVISQGGTAQVG